MNINESFKPNSKPELGSFGVEKYGMKPKLVKRDVKKDENWDDINEKNQKEYNESKEMKEAISDLEISLTFSDNELSENNKKALLRPVDFMLYVNSLIDKENVAGTIQSLTEVFDELEALYNKIENSKLNVLNLKENYKNTNDVNLDDILKKKIEKVLYNSDYLLFRIQEQIENVKSKIEEL